ncbi:MAG: hypothetical protein SV375_02665 [Thermodesulfobacteriota bacterium]|nr:hypothetical protein [Thermodesulfobacteriota bacterium]
MGYELFMLIKYPGWAALIEQVTAFGKQPETVKVRSPLGFWTDRKLGMMAIEIKRKLNSLSTVSRSPMRCQEIERKSQFESLQ